MKTIYTAIYTCFIILLLAVAALFLATLLPIPGNIKVKIVESGSMEPTILTGSVVIIKPQVHYTVGDIVTFGEDSKAHVPTTHRIREIRAGTSPGESVMITKGDANEEPDSGETPLSKIVGKVLFSIPYAGYVIDLAHKPIGFVLLIGIPALLIILDEVVNIGKEVLRLRRPQPEPVATTAPAARNASSPPPPLPVSQGPRLVDLRNRTLP
jgi:signal peptidase I